MPGPLIAPSQSQPPLSTGTSPQSPGSQARPLAYGSSAWNDIVHTEIFVPALLEPPDLRHFLLSDKLAPSDAAIEVAHSTRHSFIASPKPKGVRKSKVTALVQVRMAVRRAGLYATHHKASYTPPLSEVSEA